MPPASTVQVRRSLDRSRRRKPLRLQITRRQARGHQGEPAFVTQVRFGGAEAVVVPWDGGTRPQHEAATA
ncbi:MAG TPA: hypothetical protein VIH85_16445 [Solirubrobacteraceae bacterium]|jgi:hypothetical protein